MDWFHITRRWSAPRPAVTAAGADYFRAVRRWMAPATDAPVELTPPPWRLEWVPYQPDCHTTQSTQEVQCHGLWIQPD